MSDFLHALDDFPDVLQLVADERDMDISLVEKDYWIMHCLWGLQEQGYYFELKGGTSLSKGFGIIHRFSEDIDIRIEPPPTMGVKTGKNHNKPTHIDSRRQFYDLLAGEISIPGLDDVTRDTAFDDEKLRSAGIRLTYPSRSPVLVGVKEGVLLELGFDDTAPNEPVTISSWSWDLAHDKGLDIIDNRAVDVPCYAPTHTFVEKLQTISTKYRRLQSGEDLPVNFLRHYYDVYCLLEQKSVCEFINDPAYIDYKKTRFREGDELIIAKNPAFLLDNLEERQRFAATYRKTQALYYQGQPHFDDILARIHEHLPNM